MSGRLPGPRDHPDRRHPAGRALRRPGGGRARRRDARLRHRLHRRGGPQRGRPRADHPLRPALAGARPRRRPAARRGHRPDSSRPSSGVRARRGRLARDAVRALRPPGPHSPLGRCHRTRRGEHRTRLRPLVGARCRDVLSGRLAHGHARAQVDPRSVTRHPRGELRAHAVRHRLLAIPRGRPPLRSRKRGRHRGHHGPRRGPLPAHEPRGVPRGVAPARGRGPRDRAIRLQCRDRLLHPRGDPRIRGRGGHCGGGRRRVARARDSAPPPAPAGGGPTS